MTRDNVKIAVYPLEYSTVHRRDVVSPTPSIEHVPAYFVNINPTLETEIVDAKERSRFVRDRLIVHLNYEQRQSIRSGAYVSITHRIHEQTATWVEVPAAERTQWVVQNINQTTMTGNEYNLGLLRKDEV